MACTFDDLVDVSCVDEDINDNTNNIYSGNPTVREKVDMKLSSFAEGFLATERGEQHWLNETKLRFYLSQCSVFCSNPAVEPAQLPALTSLIKTPSFLESSSSSSSSSSSETKIKAVNLWMNISPSYSTLHYDANQVR
jgi:hypothetical protein